MSTYYFYTKTNCSLCRDARSILSLYEDKYKELTIVERDIYKNEEWLEAYQLTIPVLTDSNERIIVEGNWLDGNVYDLLDRELE